MNRNLSRRAILRGIGTALAVPWFESLTGTAWGGSAIQPAQPPVRFAVVYAPNGMHMPDWTPAAIGSSFELPAILQPLADFRGEMNVLSGLTLDSARAHGDGGGDHARALAAFLTGAHPRKTNGSNIKNGMSVDQLLATEIGHLTRFASLELGIEGNAVSGNCDSGYSCAYTSNLSWRNETTPVPKETNPQAVFDRLVGTHDAGGDQAAAQRRKYRQSVLDFVRQDAQSLQRRLGRRDQQKLDEYLHAVRDIERRLSMSQQLPKPEVDLSNFPRPAGSPETYEEHVKMMCDVIALAFQTDSTRVLTFMLANAGSDRNYRELGISGGHHELSHHGNNKDKQLAISRINQFHTTLLRHLLSRLKSVPEGEGNLLQNSILLYGSGIADGNVHNHDNLPILLFGQGGGTLATGRHLRFPSETPLTNLHLSILRRMGVNASSFGDSSGPLDALDV
jgi:hypothetical protein